LRWRGKLGLIAGVTTVVDRHHGVIDSLGSRFAFYRIGIPSRGAQVGRSLEHRRRTAGMRDELRDAVAGSSSASSCEATKTRSPTTTNAGSSSSPIS
jgi:hypothetical protein